MAYSTSNPPALISQLVGGAFREWIYRSADPAATVDTAGYITNGGALGMRVNDLVKVVDTNLGIITMHKVATVSSTYPGAVNLADGTVVGSATNTD
jgi:hypothetical protein